jgi:NADPH:quinone reductase-like Zn-dependent oxidoreductase
LIQTGGNAKYIVEHANQLVKVPTKVEACNAVVLVEAYLSAFQILMLGIKGVDRYKCRPLEGKKILIIGGISTMNQAMIELSVILGAQEIYTTSLEKHVDFLQELGATTLDIEEEEWLPIVRGKIDIVVDSLCDDHYDSPWKALNSTGRLICHGIQSILNEDPGCLTSIEELWAKTKSACMTQTTKYDVYSYWEENLEESKVSTCSIIKISCSQLLFLDSSNVLMISFY